VRIYCDQADKWQHQPLVTAVVRLLWTEHAAGVTVVNGVEGFVDAPAAAVLHEEGEKALRAAVEVMPESVYVPYQAEAAQRLELHGAFTAPLAATIPAAPSGTRGLRGADDRAFRRASCRRPGTRQSTSNLTDGFATHPSTRRRCGCIGAPDRLSGRGHPRRPRRASRYAAEPAYR
jgi:hypothetical protein